jgi:hypothetical protein
MCRRKDSVYSTFPQAGVLGEILFSPNQARRIRSLPWEPKPIRIMIRRGLACDIGFRFFAKDAIGRVFLGRVTPRLLSPDVREQMGMMGEYDNLKSPDCMAFGSEILSRLQT